MLQYKIVKSKTVLRYHPDPFWHEQTDDAPVWQQRQLVWAVGRVLFQVAVVDLEHDRRRIIRNHLNVCPDWLWDRRCSFPQKLVRGFTGDVADRRHACSCGRKMKKHKMYVQLCKHYINSNQQKKMQIYKHEKHKNTKYIIMIFCKYELYMYYYYYYTINIWYNMIIDIYNYK